MGKRGGHPAAAACKKKDVKIAHAPVTSLADRINAALTGRSINVASEPTAPQSSIPASAPLASRPSSSSGSANPTSDSFTSQRPLAPLVIKSTRASSADALNVLASEDSKRQARMQFEMDKSANSSRVTYASLWATWQKFHFEWFGRDTPVLPLTTEKISGVATLFKAGRYSSFPNYSSRAKAEHISNFDLHHSPWTEELSTAIRDATRSVQRGLGSARQSQPLDLQRVHRLQLDAEPITAEGPTSPSHFATMGIFFMTREIEIACAASTDINIDTDRKEVSWCLPVSKTDPRAIGTTRTWGCVCGGNRAIACPYHSALYQRDQLGVIAVRSGLVVDSLPLFPTYSGQGISKVAAVETITKLAALAGDRTHDDLGRPLYGGHSLRTGGAVTLAGLGVDLTKIQCMARWQSPMLLRYAKLAPLRTLTEEYRQLAKNEDAKHNTAMLDEKLSALQTVVKKLLCRLDDIDKTNALSSRGRNKSNDLFIRNAASGCWHASTVHNVSTGAGLTICGWNYGSNNSLTSDQIVGDPEVLSYCSKCLPKHAATFNRKRGAVASSSADSTSS